MDQGQCQPAQTGCVSRVLTFVKTDFYHNNSTLIEGQIVYNLFSTTDQAVNARMKKPIAKHYALGSVLSIEPLLDSVIGDFCTILEERFIDGPEGSKAFDLGAYLAYGMSIYKLLHGTQAESDISDLGHDRLLDLQQAFWIHGKGL